MLARYVKVSRYSPFKLTGGELSSLCTRPVNFIKSRSRWLLLEDKKANILHKEKDWIKSKKIWSCKENVSQGVKWKQVSKHIRDGYIIHAKGMVIYLSQEGEKINRVEQSLVPNCARLSIFSSFCSEWLRRGGRGTARGIGEEWQGAIPLRLDPRAITHRSKKALSPWCLTGVHNSFQAI